jgi:hypothetical protein
MTTFTPTKPSSSAKPFTTDFACGSSEHRKTEMRCGASFSRLSSMILAGMVLNALTTRAPCVSSARRSASEGIGVMK